MPIDSKCQGEYPARISSLYAYAPRRDSVVAFSTPATCTLPNGCELTGGQPPASVPAGERPRQTHLRALFPTRIVSAQASLAKHGLPERMFPGAGPPASGWRAHQAGSRIPGFSKRRSTKTKKRLKGSLSEPIKISASRAIGRLRPDAVEKLPEKETAK